MPSQLVIPETLSPDGAAYVLRRLAKAVPSGQVRKALAQGDAPAAYRAAFTPHAWESSIRKAVRNDIRHVVSADNGAYYMELWSSGVGKDANWYAVTGAGIHEISGVTKGMPIAEVLDYFFAEITKAEGCAPCKKNA